MVSKLLWTHVHTMLRLTLLHGELTMLDSSRSTMPLSLTTLLPICEGNEFSTTNDGPQDTRSQIHATSDVRIPPYCFIINILVL